MDKKNETRGVNGWKKEEKENEEIFSILIKMHYGFHRITESVWYVR